LVEIKEGILMKTRKSFREDNGEFKAKKKELEKVVELI
jgi:hypothetical protein